MSPNSQITLLLNDELLTVEAPPALVALDFLRQRRRLTGTKEGCKEGDCGACTVLVGELQGQTVSYRPMTSCLLPMGELHGKHLVSIEGLNMKKLSPVQAAMVDCGGTQCGYCTPGFIVAMTAGLMDENIPLNKAGHDFATSGNLCRCTGYRSIKAAGQQIFDLLGQSLQNKVRIPALCEASALPNYFLSVADRLKAISTQSSPLSSKTEYNGPVLAGGTDLFVQRGEEIPGTFPRLLNATAVRQAHERDGVIRVDARTTFESFARDPIVKAALPAIASYNELMASWPVRTRATLAGNVCNASPIADMTCLLLALEAELVIASDTSNRLVPLKNFYRGYKQLEKEPHEIITEIRFPKPKASERIHWEKVSKRKILDIATVNSAAKIDVQDGIIKRANLSLGGVAATPLFLAKTAARLQGAPLTAASVGDAIDFAQSEFNPISDVRGSAAYKRLLARQLLAAHFTTLFPNEINEETLYASLR